MSFALGLVAGRQHALITTHQLRGLGLSRRQVDLRVTKGVVIPVRLSVYRVAGAPVTWEQTVMGAALGAGRGATVSHATAAAVWGLKHCGRQSAGLHVSRPTQIRMKGVVGHRARLQPWERTVHHFIPITTPERTIMDLAATLTLRQLAECIDDALRRGLIRLDRLRRIVADAAAAGGRRLAPIHAALADRISGYRPGDSDWEKEMDRLWERLGLPPAVRQYPVKAAGHNYRIDRAIPDLRIGVEWEGFTSHGTRSGFDYGSDRRADLTAEGWHMIDFTSRSTPERIVRAVQRAVAERRRMIA